MMNKAKWHFFAYINSIYSVLNIPHLKKESDISRPVARFFSRGDAKRGDEVWSQDHIVKCSAVPPMHKNHCNFGMKTSNFSLNFMWCRLFYNCQQQFSNWTNVTVKIRFSLTFMICISQKIFHNLVLSSNFTILDYKKCW